MNHVAEVTQSSEHLIKYNRSTFVLPRRGGKDCSDEPFQQFASAAFSLLKASIAGSSQAL